jgi:hypothetical protein
MSYDQFISYTTISGIGTSQYTSYPIPSFDTAIKILCPTAIKWEFDNESCLLWEDSEGNNPPSWKEIHEEIKREVEIFNSYWYYRSRISSYPPIEVQLDMLYHDIKSGNIQDGEWINTIDKIKNTYPKGSGSDLFVDPT